MPATTVCPCGKRGRSDNIRRHMRDHCKLLKAAADGSFDLSNATKETLITALSVKDAQLTEAQARIAELEAQPKVTNNINGNVTVTINPVLDRDGGLIDPESLPWKRVVHKKLAKQTPSEAVPEYVKMKHFLCGPEFSNLRIENEETGLEVVQETKDRRGPCDWKPAPEGTLEAVVENAFCELENHYELASVHGLGWKEWTDSEKLWMQDEEGDTVIDTNKEAFAKAVADTEEMIAGFSLPLHSTHIEDKTDEPESDSE